ncbi:hypothetical protein N7456_005547 [Penicillium angulare]|uniref:Uncharacterized protein n=1 Tax=Penicillium angulare TaxID=116970 RepID=A0A9W9KKN1_9EURO|nr:hypothetical protein N7456_005547 [Penicillium angulare]
MSSLYEQFKEDSTLETPSRKFAVQHYNAAMKQVMCSTNTNLDTVVIACILFMSIEFLRGNVAGALLHHRHGKKILGSYNSDPQLLGIFRQLNVFFLFFSEFSDLSTLSVVGGPPVAGPFHHIGQAREALDWLTYRSMKVAFTIDQGTSGDCPPSILSSFQTSKHSLDQELYGWLNAFTALQASTAPEQEVAYRLLEARWLICRIWSDTGLFQSPVHNAHDGSFQRIMDLVSVVSGVESKDSAEFIMGFGFPSILHFMVMRSRNLDFRLAALDMFRGKCCCSSEVFWDSKMLYLTAKKAIEEEHGIILESDWAEESESGRLIGSKNFRQPMFSRAQFLCPWVVVVMDVCDRIQQGT